MLCPLTQSPNSRGAIPPFQEILVWKFSRFTRKLEHAVAFKSMLRRKGVRVVSITEHADDTPAGKLMEAIIESVDEFYSENLAQEVTGGCARPPLAASGSPAPAGKLWSKNGIHFILRNEVYTGAKVWDANAKDKAEPVRVDKAFPAIISKTRFRRVNRLVRSRAPKITHPHRVGSSYLLSGLVKCKTCNRALSGQA